MMIPFRGHGRISPFNLLLIASHVVMYIVKVSQSVLRNEWHNRVTMSWGFRSFSRSTYLLFDTCYHLSSHSLLLSFIP